VSEPLSPTRTHSDVTLRLTPGAVLAGRYRVEEILGVGGMGIVYRAHDQELGVDVALKLLRPDLAQAPDRVERLRREVLLARKVSHRAVVRTHDIGQDGGLWFLTMDFVAGRSLRRVLEEEKRLAPERVVAIARQLAQALAAAHAEGVVHRDLTPANILVGEGDRVWITDFGLARSLAGGGGTQAGTVLGTLDYLSPEQATGEEADARSDFYALGVILFELVTGELPFRGVGWSEVLAQRLHARPRDLAQSGVEVPPALARVVRRCLEREPRRRYASADELLVELDGGRGQRIRWRTLTAAAALAALAATAAVWLARRDVAVGARSEASAAAPSTSARYSVAVLPLRDETGRPELAWLGAALAERLSEGLAAERDLRVVASARLSSAVADLKLGTGGWREADLGQVAQLFEVDRVVSGTLRGTLRGTPQADGSGATERLAVELRVADQGGRELAAAERISLDAGVDDLGALTDALLGALRGRFELAATGASAATPKTPAAFAAFAEGAAKLTAGDLDAAVERLETAVAAEPASSAAWLRLAEALEGAGYDERALAAAERAVAALEGSNSRLALEARARHAVLLGEPERARTFLAELARRFPNDVDLAVATAEAAGELGDLDAAERELARAVALDAQHPRAWYLRGKYSILAGNARGAVDEHLVRAQVIQNRLRNDQGRADVMNAFGVAYRQLGELDRAEEQYAQAAELRRTLGDKRGVATTLRNLAGIASVRGDLARAEARLNEAQGILQELGDRAGMADLYNELGVLAEDRGNAEAALADYRRGLELRRKLGDQRGAAESLSNVGYAYYLLGQYDNARAYWQQSLELHRKVGNAEGEILIAQSFGQLALAQGEWRPAAKSFLDALEGSRRIGLEPAVAVSLGNLGRLASYEGRFGAAIASYGEARELLVKLDDPRGLAEFALAEAECWLEVGATARALERLAEAERWLEGGNHEQRAELFALRAAASATAADAAATDAALVAGRREANASGSRVAITRLELAAGLVALSRGRHAEARELLEQVLASASALDHAWLELRAREALAMAALASGDAGRSALEARHALRRADRCGSYARRWRLHAALASALRAQGDSAAASAELARAKSELRRLSTGLEGELRATFEQLEDVRGLGSA
jgi:tetratricopeptide (TPR) repeat protein/predicted Ser/Thr protein kinase